MEITVLIENLGLRHLICEHGLSLHINCKGRSILLDMGSSGALAQNARELTAIGVGGCTPATAPVCQPLSCSGGGWVTGLLICRPVTASNCN